MAGEAVEYRQRKEIELIRGKHEDLEDRLVTCTFDRDPGVIVIEHVPARVNAQTGEAFFSPATVERIHVIVRERRSPTRTIAACVCDFAA